MFKNNIENQFSKDLLDEVKKVMQKKTDEAKNDLPWSEDPKNPTRSAGTRKDKYGNIIKNTAKYLARKAMKANEETTADKWNVVRSGKVISSHSSKDAADAKAMKHPLNRVVANEEVEDLDENAKIVTHLQKRYGDNIRKSHVMSAAKDFGVDASKLAKAVRTKLGKNMLDEEQIDEISVAKLDQYRTKARKDIIDTDDSDEKRINKRAGGYMAASRQVAKKLAKEEAEDIKESFLTPNAHAELKNMPKDAVKRHLDTYMTTHKMFKKNGSHALAAAAMGAANEIKSKYMSEDAEQIDELSKKPGGMLDTYQQRGTFKGDKNRDVGRKLATRKMNPGKYGLEPAKVSATEEAQFEQDAMNLSAEEFEAKWLAPRVNAVDEAFDSLFEGRPKIMIQHPWDKDRKLHPVKDQALIAKLRAKGYTNLGDRPSSENPINQLRKASTSMTGGHHVTLHTGEKHPVTGNQASRILDKHAGMKTAQEKLDYQDKLRDKDFLKKEAGQ